MTLSIERRTAVVHLFHPDDEEHLADLSRAIESAAVAAGPKRIADDDPVKTAAAGYDKALAKAKRSGTPVKLTALSRKAWRTLLAAHPPRQDVRDGEGEVTQSWPEDRQAGFNTETIADPLVVVSVDLEGQFDTEDERHAFVDDLSDPAFSRLYSEAVRLNTEAGPDPKFSASSWLEQTSAVMSRSDDLSDESPASSTPSRPEIETSS